MLIACPTCATAYAVDPEKLGDGRPVRCTRCRTTWIAGAPAAPDPAFAAPPEDDPAAEQTAFAEPDPAAQPEPPTEPEALPDWQEDEAVAEENPTVSDDAPPLVPAETAAEPAAGAESVDIETLASRRARIAQEKRSRRRRPGGGLPLALVLLVAGVTAVLAWRTHIVRAAPQSASLYAAIGLAVNLRGLEFRDVKTTEEMQDNVPVLVVEGTVANVANGTVEVPRMRFAVRSLAGLEIYAWTALPERPVLSRGETMPFRSRLASPPADAHDVVVRFFHRRDREAGR